MLYLLPYSLWCFLNIFLFFSPRGWHFCPSLLFSVVTSLVRTPFPTSLFFPASVRDILNHTELISFV